MTNDRELLEAAAKAAGVSYDSDASKPHPKSGAFWGLWLTFDHVPSEYDRRYWNPLTDNGDALRLAIRLDLLSKPEMWHYLGLERFGAQEQDDCHAHRRAIVRAAAAIVGGGER